MVDRVVWIRERCREKGLCPRLKRPVCFGVPERLDNSTFQTSSGRIGARRFD